MQVIPNFILHCILPSLSLAEVYLLVIFSEVYEWWNFAFFSWKYVYFVPLLNNSLARYRILDFYKLRIAFGYMNSNLVNEAGMGGKSSKSLQNGDFFSPGSK